MLSPISVKILLDEEDKIFFPGERVEGIIEVNVTCETLINTITMKTKGSANVRWKEQHSMDEKNDMVYYTNTEKYYQCNLTLLGNGSVPIKLKEGKHKFPFSLDLPPNIPCSFESKYGYLRHICKAVVNVAGKVPKVEHFAIISVGVLVDLNYDTMAKKQITEWKSSKDIFSTKNKPGLSLILNCGRSGFVPGQNLRIHAECFNRSRQSTKETKLSLFQIATYRATGNSKKVVKTLINSKIHPKTKPGDDDIWMGTLLKVPPLPPSGLPGCNIIDLDYELNIRICARFPSKDLSVSVPIIIGTIPLKSTFGTIAQEYSDTICNGSCVPSSIDTRTTNQTTKTAVSVPWDSEYPDLPLPTIKPFLEEFDDSESRKDEESPKKPIKYMDSKTNITFSPFYVFYKEESLRRISCKA